MTTTCPKCAEDVPVGAGTCPHCDSRLASGAAPAPTTSATLAATAGGDPPLLDARGVRITRSTIEAGGSTYAVRGISGVVVKQVPSRRKLLTWVAIAIPAVCFGGELLSFGPVGFVGLFTDTFALAAIFGGIPLIGSAICLQRSLRHPPETWVVEVLTPAGSQRLLATDEGGWAERVAGVVNRAVRGAGS